MKFGENPSTEYSGLNISRVFGGEHACAYWRYAPIGLAYMPQAFIEAQSLKPLERSIMFHCPNSELLPIDNR